MSYHASKSEENASEMSTACDDVTDNHQTNGDVTRTSNAGGSTYDTSPVEYTSGEDDVFKGSDSSHTDVVTKGIILMFSV